MTAVLVIHATIDIKVHPSDFIPLNYLASLLSYRCMNICYFKLRIDTTCYLVNINIGGNFSLASTDAASVLSFG